MKVGNWIKYVGYYPQNINSIRKGKRISFQIKRNKTYKILKVNTLMGEVVSYEVEFGSTYFTLHITKTDNWVMDLEKERLEKIKSIGL